MVEEVKRFWTGVSVIEGEGGFGVALDAKPLKTPVGTSLVVPTRALAEGIAAEWKAAGETVDPRAMPFTGLANAAIDRAGDDLVAGIARYATSDQFASRRGRLRWSNAKPSWTLCSVGAAAL